MRAVTLYKCTGEDETELSFEVGQVIYDVKADQEQGWFTGLLIGTGLNGTGLDGTVLDGTRGLFPGNHVRFEEDPVSQGVSKMLDLSLTTTLDQPYEKPKINVANTRSQLEQRSSALIDDRIAKARTNSKSNILQNSSLPDRSTPLEAKIVRKPESLARQSYISPNNNNTIQNKYSEKDLTARDGSIPLNQVDAKKTAPIPPISRKVNDVKPSLPSRNNLENEITFNPFANSTSINKPSLPQRTNSNNSIEHLVTNNDFYSQPSGTKIPSRSVPLPILNRPASTSYNSPTPSLPPRTNSNNIIEPFVTNNDFNTQPSGTKIPSRPVPLPIPNRPASMIKPSLPNRKNDLNQTDKPTIPNRNTANFTISKSTLPILNGGPQDLVSLPIESPKTNFPTRVTPKPPTPTRPISAAPPIPTRRPKPRIPDIELNPMKNRYTCLFHEKDKFQTGVLHSSIVRSIWLRSLIDSEDLAMIWGCLKVSDGGLHLGEFRLGLFLIDRYLGGFVQIDEDVAEYRVFFG
jgi:hypothetical protein